MVSPRFSSIFRQYLLSGLSPAIYLPKSMLEPNGEKSQSSVTYIEQLIVSDIICQPLPEVDPKKNQPNIGLAKIELGWEPKVNLEHGLKEIIAFLKCNF